MKIKEQEIGKFGLIQLTEKGIKQIGLTQSNYNVLEMMLAEFSKEKPLPMLPEEYDLILKNK